jgi:hypothetical protein
VSLVVVFSFLAGLIAAGIAFLLFRRRAWMALGVGFAAFAGAAVWLLMPVCVVIASADVAGFDPPIETRTETGIIGQRYFQERGGRWYQCKTRIAREFFF